MRIPLREREGLLRAMSVKSGGVSLRHETMHLHLRHTFATARDAEDEAATLLLRLNADGEDAIGESAPSSRYGDNIDSVARQLDALDLSRIDLWHIDVVLNLLPLAQRAAMCALDLALHDLVGKRLGIPLYQYFGLDPAEAKRTSFTIGLADIETMLSKTREAAHLPILKVKLRAGNEIDTIEALRSSYTGTIRIDANEAWEPEQAVNVLRELKRFDIEFCEQPIKAGQIPWLRYVHELSPIPILVDEDCRTLDDLAALAGFVDGVNIKLVKCGGIREAVRMIHTARALKLKVMLGCMIESSILATAAAHLTPLVDYADLDGPLLISDDPFDGVRYRDAKLALPDAPGLGVKPKAAVKVGA